MPAWGGVLTGKEAADVTAFIRTLAMHDENKRRPDCQVKR